MAENESYKPTILDYLNEDCWLDVLKYVPVADIIKTECASRRWQNAVLTYLRGIRIGVESRNIGVSKELNNVRKICVSQKLDFKSFEKWSYKLGCSVVAMYWDCENEINTIQENCSNLEAIKIIELSENILSINPNKYFTCLRRVSFHNCHMSDQCLTQFIASKHLEKIKINGNQKVTGQCLGNIHSRKLRCLQILNCLSLELSHLQSAFVHFGGLTKLVLYKLPGAIYDNIPLLLKNTPKLKCLKIIDYWDHSFNYFELVCRLGSLKHLTLYVRTVTDKDLEAVTLCCKQLQSLNVDGQSESEEAQVTAQGVAAACRNAGARFTNLGLGYTDLSDDDVLACVRACPNLTLLDLRYCSLLTPALPALAASARRQMCVRSPLRFLVADTQIADMIGMNFEEIIIDRD